MGGRIQPEWVAGLRRNTQYTTGWRNRGIGTRVPAAEHPTYSGIRLDARDPKRDLESRDPSPLGPTKLLRVLRLTEIN